MKPPYYPPHSSFLMEFQLPSFSILLGFFFFVFMLLKIRNRSKTINSTSNLPPGPWKLPFIGSMHHLAGSLPHHALRDLAKKHGPLMHLQLGEVSAVVVSSPEAAKEVMKTHDIIFASRPHILSSKIISYDATDIAFAPYGEYWRQLRKICVLELLSNKRVQSFRLLRKEETLSLITSVASSCKAGSPINLTAAVYSHAFGTTSKAAFGKKIQDQEAFISLVKESIKVGAGFTVADVYPSIKLLHLISGVRRNMEKLHQGLDDILESIINEHRAKALKGEGQACKDLVDVLLQYQDGKHDFSLTTDNIKAVILDIFGAGSETSATTIDWSMIEMLKNPSLMRKAQDEVRQVCTNKGDVDEADLHELEYLHLVIKETLRLHPPAPLLLPRECSERCEINGYEIPVKTKVIVNAWAIGRDPKIWADAESFKPERFLDSSIDYKGTSFEYIPFGSGRRICPGMSFGLAVVELLLAKLLYHFDWKLPSGMKQEELDMTERFGATVRRKDDLYVIPVAYQPLSVKT